MSDECRELLAAFAAAAGIGALPGPDDNGVFRMTNGQVSFGFGELADSRELLVEADLCDVPETGRAKFLTALAQASFMGYAAAGGALALSDGDRVTLFRRFALDGLTAEALAEAFEALAAVAFEWPRIAEAYLPVAEREEQTWKAAQADGQRAFRGEWLQV